MWPRLTIASVVAATTAITIAQEPVAIGIVREDGLLMPIARITSRGFEVRTPPAQTFVNGEPIGPAPLTAPEWSFKALTWTLSPARAQQPIEITTVESMMVQMPYCADRRLWRTTLKRPPVKQGYAPIRKIGLAVRGAAIEHPENVADRSDADSQRVARRVLSLFESKEKVWLAGQQGPLAASARRRALPIRIQQLVRHSAAGVAVYYFEATKDVQVSDTVIARDDRLVTGWIADTATGLEDYDVVYKINDDSYKQNDRATVRGIVPFQGRALWLLEWHGWESEYYTLHDWPSGALRLTVDAYECS